jgi:hypothetical protein
MSTFLSEARDFRYFAPKDKKEETDQNRQERLSRMLMLIPLVGWKLKIGFNYIHY